MAARALALASTLVATVAAVAHGEAPIVGGTVDSGDPAVVAIAHRPVGCGDAPVAFCSGVLVSSRVVLTAAHCLDGMPPRGALEVVFGDLAAPAEIHVVESTEVDADYNAATGDGDVAMLLLAEPSPTPAIARPTASIADVAAAATLRTVGYGVTSFTANDPGIKRETTMMLGAVGAGTFDASPAPGLTCAADSGGPVFATVNASEQLVGLTSRGDPGCSANAVNVRVDVEQSSLVDPFVAASSSAPLGWPANALALDALATTSCTSDTDCPALMRCLDQQVGPRCGFSSLGDGSFAAACTTDSECGAAPTARCARVWPSGADACHCFVAANPPSEPPPDGCGCSSGRGDASWLLLVLVALAGTAQRKFFHARDQRRP